MNLFSSVPVSPRWFLVLFLMIIGVTKAYATEFAKGEVVFVAFPAGNIKDDAFIIGKVKAHQANGDYLISVMDYVEGHDYGSSCVPMIKTEDPEATKLGFDKGWQMWTDTTTLDKENLDYVVPQKNVMKLLHGKQYFVERNNLYIVFGRWKSDAPVLTIDRWNRAEREAKEAGLKDMIPAFEIAKLHRKSFYAETNRPLYPFERIKPLVTMLELAKADLEADPKLKSWWQSSSRDWPLIYSDTKRYFLIEAIDKAVMDAKDQLYESGVEEAGEENIQRLESLLEYFKKDKQKIS